MARYSKYSEGELVDYIRRAILAGKYKPREHLVEKELSDYYHVSRTPIREALRQLCASHYGIPMREQDDLIVLSGTKGPWWRIST